LEENAFTRISFTDLLQIVFFVSDRFDQHNQGLVLELRVNQHFIPHRVVQWYQDVQAQAINIELRCLVGKTVHDILAPLAPFFELPIPTKNVIIIDWSFRMARDTSFTNQLLDELRTRNVTRVVLCDTYALLSPSETESCCHHAICTFPDMRFGYCTVNRQQNISALEKIRRAYTAGVHVLHVNLSENDKMSIPLITKVTRVLTDRSVELSTTFSFSGLRMGGTNFDL